MVSENGTFYFIINVNMAETSKTYTDFKEFFSEQYYTAIANACKAFFYANRDNKSRFGNDYIFDPSYVAYEDHHVQGVFFRTTDLKDEIEFQVVVQVDYEIKGKTKDYWKNKDFDSDSGSIWLGIHFKALLKDGLRNVKRVDVDEYQQRVFYKQNKSTTKYLVPYISSKDLDNKAEEFLKLYCPEALKNPMPLPVDLIVRKVGLTPYYAPMEENIFGKTYFGDGEVTVYKDKFDLRKEKIKATKGTMLINLQSSFMKGIGNENNTKIHECCHWHFHKLFFELQEILNPKTKALVCSTVENYNKNGTRIDEELEWMEWQANCLAPRILMPKKMFIAKYQSLLQANLVEANGQELADVYRNTIKDLADFFQVTFNSAKARLVQLGYKEHLGLDPFIDGEVGKSFHYNTKLLSDDQTPSGDYKNLIDIVTNNRKSSKIVNLFFQHKLVIADGSLILNDTKYYYYDEDGIRRLTDYARLHLDECAILFDIEYKNKFAFDSSYYKTCYLCRSGESPLDTEFNVDPKSGNNAYVLDVASKIEVENEDLTEAKDIVAAIQTKNFNEAMDYVITHCYEGTERQLALAANVSNTYINQIRTTNKVPSKEVLLKIIAVLKIHYLVSDILVTKAGINLLGTGNDLDIAYFTLLHDDHKAGLTYWRRRLKDLGYNNPLE